MRAPTHRGSVTFRDKPAIMTAAVGRTLWLRGVAWSGPASSLRGSGDRPVGSMSGNCSTASCMPWRIQDIAASAATSCASGWPSRISTCPGGQFEGANVVFAPSLRSRPQRGQAWIGHVGDDRSPVAHPVPGRPAPLYWNSRASTENPLAVGWPRERCRTSSRRAGRWAGSGSAGVTSLEPARLLRRCHTAGPAAAGWDGRRGPRLEGKASHGRGPSAGG